MSDFEEKRVIARNQYSHEAFVNPLNDPEDESGSEALVLDLDQDETEEGADKSHDEPKAQEQNDGEKEEPKKEGETQEVEEEEAPHPQDTTDTAELKA